MACHSVPRVLTLGDSASVEIIVLTPRAVERLHTDLGVDSERHLSLQRDK